MKTKFLLLIAIASLSLTACHKETATNSPAPDCSQNTKVAALLALSNSDLFNVASKLVPDSARTINGVTYTTQWCDITNAPNALRFEISGESSFETRNINLITQKLRDALSGCQCGF